MAQSRLNAKGDRASAPAPATSAPGTSCSSAGWTTRPSCAGQKSKLKLGPPEYNTQEGPGRHRPAAEEGGHDRPRRPRRSGTKLSGPARATTSANVNDPTRSTSPAGRASLDAPGPSTTSRTGLRLPVRPGRVPTAGRRGPHSNGRRRGSRSATNERHPASTAPPRLRAGEVRPRRAYAGQDGQLRFHYRTDGGVGRRSASSPTTSPSPPTARRASPTVPRAGRTAGPPTGSHRDGTR